MAKITGFAVVLMHLEYKYVSTAYINYRLILLTEKLITAIILLFHHSNFASHTGFRVSQAEEIMLDGTALVCAFCFILLYQRYYIYDTLRSFHFRDAGARPALRSQISCLF